MIDSLSIGKDSFDKVESLEVPADRFYLTTTISLKLFIQILQVTLQVRKNITTKLRNY